jgi:two-component system, OmpR family, sensor kinase
MSLRLRLALFGVGVVALTLVLFGSLLYALVSRSVNTNQDDALRARAHEAAASASLAPDLAPRPPLAPADLRTSTDVFVEVFDLRWTLIYTTAQLNGLPPMPPARVLAEAPGVTEGAFDTNDGFRYFVLPFGQGYVVTGQSTKVPQSNLSGIVGFLVISGIPTLLAALAASWLVAGRALRPLKSVAVTAEDIGRTRDFGRRLPVPRSRDEVATLSASFNGMLSRLQETFESQRRFVADASHELRTPLATIQGNAGLLAQGPPIAESVRQAAATDIAEESERMGRLVDRLLTLARADAGLRLELAPVDVRSVVLDVTRQAAAVHPERTFDVHVVDAGVDGDEDALRQLLWILLDNALRYSLSKISVDLEVDSGWARLMVGDDGPGIAIDERDRIFQRFYRTDASRAGQGAGLGLSIARWITEQHGGRIIAGEGKAGGAGLYVDLPLLRRS